MEEAKGGLEERVARIEGILSQMDKRLNHLESRFTQFEAREHRVKVQSALLCRDHELGDDHRRPLGRHLQGLSFACVKLRCPLRLLI
jgi:hypothetical protein